MRFTRACTGFFTATFLATFLTSCATTRQAGWDKSSGTSSITASEVKKKKAEALALWGKRLNQSDLEASLRLFEQLVNQDANDVESLVYLTRGYYFLADGHMTEEAQKKATWETGTAWGERALATNASFRKRVKDEGKKIEEALDTLTAAEVPALYWTASNLGKWARLSGLPTMLANKNRIRLMIERVEALKPDYFYGAAPRYWGAYYAVAPSFAGGSLTKSEENFQRSLKMSNDYFGTHVLIADTLAPKKGDKEMFKKHLEFVLKAKPESLPDIVPEQIVEQRKAKKMMDKMAEYF
ncbi:MAG: hypothetical protein RIQ81_1782 [Pseudomonadota bacterium]|jgi:predicted small secreted protein